MAYAADDGVGIYYEEVGTAEDYTVGQKFVKSVPPVADEFGE